MHIPASRLIEHLNPEVFVELRAHDYSCADDSLPYEDALVLILRGEVEGIATPSGRIKYLRLLPESERLAAPESPDMVDRAESKTGRIGAPPTVFREAVESSEMDEWGVPTRIIIGHIWQHCRVRP
jgi:hypothetical protein